MPPAAGYTRNCASFETEKPTKPQQPRLVVPPPIELSEPNNKAYNDKKCKGALRRGGIKSRIASKGVQSSETLG
jgi:hypothetical protein